MLLRSSLLSLLAKQHPRRIFVPRRFHGSETQEHRLDCIPRLQQARLAPYPIAIAIAIVHLLFALPFHSYPTNFSFLL
jgi:hypothetical protein